MRREISTKDILSMRIINKILSGNFLELSIFSQKYQLIHIRITNLAGIPKHSIWEEIQQGTNSMIVDVSGLTKGPYKITIDFPEENSREELFTIY